jgi:hypothetical protein
MKRSTDCAHEACECRAERFSPYCSAECQTAATQASATGGCACGHGACHAKDAASGRSLDGNQGEGNREADRLYREGATEFARSGRASEAARDAAVDLDELERAGRKQREKL